MKLKKINAVLSLLTIFFILIHIGYNVYCYLAFYYNPTLKTITAMPIMVLACLHGICGMISVFLMGDGTRLDLYPKQNKRTIIQRVSAALIFPLLILHLNTFNLLKSSAEENKMILFYTVIFCQILFYAIIIIHTVTSASKAFITLGLLSSPQKQKKLDKIIYIAGALIFVFAVFAVVKTQFSMFFK
ncbi:MAG: hypothetical protein IKP88_15450 [Lachnospiraceae bacterium]|nr:hypothetical protein [Lachnospiraceae bacterium]